MCPDAEPLLENCPDCGAETSQLHAEGCDVARCLFTGRQRLMCDGLHVEEVMPGCYVPWDGCGQDAWTGTWPGETECAAFGWWAFFRPPQPPEQYGEWVPCEPDHPDAVPDFSRLQAECTWDRTRREWVRP